MKYVGAKINNKLTTMSLLAHIKDLRKCILHICLAICLGMIISYNFKEVLLTILIKPIATILIDNNPLIYTNLPDAFINYLKICFFSSLLFTSPYNFYRIWEFISPGFYKKEKKHILQCVILTTTLFIIGVIFCYIIILPPTFKFFISFSNNFLKPMLSLKDYLSLVLHLLFIFGIIFEIPVFFYFLAKINIIKPDFFKIYRKYTILFCFFLSAILTPTPDAFSQILMAIPMILLYEISNIIIFLMFKKGK